MALGTQVVSVWKDATELGAAAGKAALELCKDPVLDAVPAPLRERLVAKREGTVYRFDIRLKGDGETPFFDD